MFSHQFSYNQVIHLCEVLYYFQCRIHGSLSNVAVISMYSEPHPELLKESHGTFISCKYSGDNSLIVVNISCIQAVVAIVPHWLHGIQGDDDRFFLVEKPGLDVADLDSTDESIDTES